MDNALIRAVYMFPEIYDLTLISYKNSQQKEMAWKKISEHVCVPVALCRRRWKGLRDTYIREVKKEMTAIKSGAEAVGSRKRWKYTGDLAFLNPFIKGFENMEQHVDTENWTGGGYHSNTEPVLLEVNYDSSCAEKPAEIEVKTEDIVDEPEKESTVGHGMVNCMRTLSEPTVKQSSAELFCRSIVPHLERLPLEKLIKVQIQILQVVQDATGS
ncbi:unnamed protein product [Lota lota]